MKRLIVVAAALALSATRPRNPLTFPARLLIALLMATSLLGSVSAIPAFAAGLTVTTVSTTQAILSWTDVPNGSTIQWVKRCAGVGCNVDLGDQIVTGGSNNGMFNDNGLTPGVTYFYRVNGLAGFFDAYGGAPAVTGLAPTAGTSAGGTSVVITGAAFTGVTAVTFGGTAATSFTAPISIANALQQITATSPAHAAGTVDVVVTTLGGSSATSGTGDDYSYATTSLSPTAAKVGATVTVSGSGFTSTATSVSVSGTPLSASVTCTLSSGAISANCTFAVKTGTADGTYTITATDNATTPAAVTASLVVDSTAPTATITFPVDTKSYNATGWTGALTGTAADPGTSTTSSGLKMVEVSILNKTTNKYWNGTDFTTLTAETFQAATGTTSWSYTLATSALTDGVSYTVHAKATDNASNVSTIPAATFTYDTTLPAAPTVSATTPVSPAKTTGVTVTGTAENSSTVTTYTDTACTTLAAATAAAASGTANATTGAFSIALTVTKNTTTSFYATATDAAGNVSACSTNTVTFTEDEIAPTVSFSFPVAATTYNAASWNAGCTPAGICGISADAGAVSSGVAKVEMSKQQGTSGMFFNGSTSAFTSSTQIFNQAIPGTAASGSTPADWSTWRFSFASKAAGFTDGPYTLQLKVTDAAGNVTTAPAVTFTVTNLTITENNLAPDPRPLRLVDGGPVNLDVMLVNDLTPTNGIDDQIFTVTLPSGFAFDPSRLTASTVAVSVIDSGTCTAAAPCPLVLKAGSFSATAGTASFQLNESTHSASLKTGNTVRITAPASSITTPGLLGPQNLGVTITTATGGAIEQATAGWVLSQQIATIPVARLSSYVLSTSSSRTSNATLIWNNTAGIPKGGSLRVTFPTGFGVLAAPTCVFTPSIGAIETITGVGVAASGSTPATVTCTRPGTGADLGTVALTPIVPQVLTINGVTNPKGIDLAQDLVTGTTPTSSTISGVTGNFNVENLAGTNVLEGFGVTATAGSPVLTNAASANGAVITITQSGTVLTATSSAPFAQASSIQTATVDLSTLLATAGNGTQTVLFNFGPTATPVKLSITFTGGGSSTGSISASAWSTAISLALANQTVALDAAVTTAVPTYPTSLKLTAGLPLSVAMPGLDDRSLAIVSGTVFQPIIATAASPVLTNAASTNGAVITITQSTTVLTATSSAPFAQASSIQTATFDLSTLLATAGNGTQTVLFNFGPTATPVKLSITFTGGGSPSPTDSVTASAWSTAIGLALANQTVGLTPAGTATGSTYPTQFNLPNAISVPVAQLPFRAVSNTDPAFEFTFTPQVAVPPGGRIRIGFPDNFDLSGRSVNASNPSGVGPGDVFVDDIDAGVTLDLSSVSEGSGISQTLTIVLDPLSSMTAGSPHTVTIASGKVVTPPDTADVPFKGWDLTTSDIAGSCPGVGSENRCVLGGPISISNTSTATTNTAVTVNGTNFGLGKCRFPVTTAACGVDVDMDNSVQIDATQATVALTGSSADEQTDLFLTWNNLAGIPRDARFLITVPKAFGTANLTSCAFGAGGAAFVPDGSATLLSITADASGNSLVTCARNTDGLGWANSASPTIKLSQVVNPAAAILPGTFALAAKNAAGTTLESGAGITVPSIATNALTNVQFIYDNLAPNSISDVAVLVTLPSNTDIPADAKIAFVFDDPSVLDADQKHRLGTAQTSCGSASVTQTAGVCLAAQPAQLTGLTLSTTGSTLTLARTGATVCCKGQTLQFYLRGVGTPLGRVDPTTALPTASSGPQQVQITTAAGDPLLTTTTSGQLFTRGMLPRDDDDLVGAATTFSPASRQAGTTGQAAVHVTLPLSGYPLPADGQIKITLGSGAGNWDLSGLVASPTIGTVIAVDTEITAIENQSNLSALPVFGGTLMVTAKGTNSITLARVGGNRIPSQPLLSSGPAAGYEIKFHIPNVATPNPAGLARTGFHTIQLLDGAGTVLAEQTDVRGQDIVPIANVLTSASMSGSPLSCPSLSTCMVLDDTSSGGKTSALVNLSLTGTSRTSLDPNGRIRITLPPGFSLAGSDGLLASGLQIGGLGSSSVGTLSGATSGAGNVITYTWSGTPPPAGSNAAPSGSSVGADVSFRVPNIQLPGFAQAGTSLGTATVDVLGPLPAAATAGSPVLANAASTAGTTVTITASGNVLTATSSATFTGTGTKTATFDLSTLPGTAGNGTQTVAFNFGGTTAVKLSITFTGTGPASFCCVSTGAWASGITTSLASKTITLSAAGAATAQTYSTVASAVSLVPGADLVEARADAVPLGGSNPGTLQNVSVTLENPLRLSRAGLTVQFTTASPLPPDGLLSLSLPAANDTTGALEFGLTSSTLSQVSAFSIKGPTDPTATPANVGVLQLDTGFVVLHRVGGATAPAGSTISFTLTNVHNRGATTAFNEEGNFLRAKQTGTFDLATESTALIDQKLAVPGVAIQAPGTLTNVAVTTTSQATSQVTDAQVSFKTSAVIPANGKITVDFPSDNVEGLRGAGFFPTPIATAPGVRIVSGLVGPVQARVEAAPHDDTVLLSGWTSDIPAGTTVSFTLSSIKTPTFDTANFVTCSNESWEGKSWWSPSVGSACQNGPAFWNAVPGWNDTTFESTLPSADPVTDPIRVTTRDFQSGELAFGDGPGHGYRAASATSLCTLSRCTGMSVLPGGVGALRGASVVVDAAPGSTGTATIQFTLSNGLPARGAVVVTMPDAYKVSENAKLVSGPQGFSLGTESTFTITGFNPGASKPTSFSTVTKAVPLGVGSGGRLNRLLLLGGAPIPDPSGFEFVPVPTGLAALPGATVTFQVSGITNLGEAGKPGGFNLYTAEGWDAICRVSVFDDSIGHRVTLPIDCNESDLTDFFTDQLTAMPVGDSLTYTPLVIGEVIDEAQLVAGQAGAFSLQSSTSTVATGGFFSVGIRLSPGGPVDTAEAHLTFDPALLQVVPDSSASSCLKVGSALTSVAQNACNNTTGTIDFAAAKFQAPFPTTSLTLGTIAFKAIGAANNNASLTFCTGDVPAPPKCPATKTQATFAGQPVASTASSSSVPIAAGFSGSVGFEVTDRGAAGSTLWRNQPLRVRVFTAGTSTVLVDTTVLTDASGNFAAVLPPTSGTFDIQLKHVQGISVKKTVTLPQTAGAVASFGTLLNGDITNDDVVDTLDLSTLRVTFLQCVGDSGFDGRADLNGDNCADISDFSIMRRNFGSAGPK